MTTSVSSLPGKLDIHEYAIIQDFCHSIDDDELRGLLLDKIRGAGAFRRFKNAIQPSLTPAGGAGDAPSTTRSGQSHPDHIQPIDPNRQPPYTMRQVTGQKGNDQVAFVVAFGDLAKEAGAQAIAKLVAAAIK